MTTEEYNISVENFSDGAYRFILKNIRDQNKAQDIVQDTYEKLWINVSIVDFKKVKSYIFSTAYHTMIDLIRREKRKVDFEEVNLLDYSHSEHYSDLNEILNEAIDKLPDIQKSVVLLRDYEGYSYKEIAEITNLNESQVKVYIFRARKYLKNYIVSTEVVV
ncbi:MAG: RNA polymerase sigma factor [Bacteroidetes bacterium]|jgi:RNA polymerase sigma factor (sigma-70 family)|nr:RNA polymerase sigma factor [Bacteroidota bacterium]MBT6686284.1 RNA polymerase sigma factor [Bacteroidota bacterium]MBT7145086.1 RNA polymerase sigma factor [Bacteroidota bacterium]MBT7490196.1 RNA polymerase sigma factor [Bacteroidota bacterium]